MNATKNSKKRDAVRAFIMNSSTHPTADEIYSHVKTEFPKVSLGTVYRNLNQLEEAGEIKRLSFTDGPDHYDRDTSIHYHYICRKCGRIYDMPSGVKEAIVNAVKSGAPGTVESHDLVFYGVCSECLKKPEIKDKV